MEQGEYDDLLRRLTTLVVKLDERDDHIMALLEEQREFNKEQREFNTQQVQINARLESLMMRVFQERSNGQE